MARRIVEQPADAAPAKLRADVAVATERESKPFLCMIPTPGDRRFLDPDRWYYTGADSDLDTLEVQPAPRRPVTGVKADRPTIPLPPA